MSRDLSSPRPGSAVLADARRDCTPILRARRPLSLAKAFSSMNTLSGWGGVGANIFITQFHHHNTKVRSHLPRFIDILLTLFQFHTKGSPPSLPSSS